KAFHSAAGADNRPSGHPSSDKYIFTIPSARVGRKSLQRAGLTRGAAPSASPQSRAYSHRAGLSSQSGSARDVLLHGEPAGPPVGFAVTQIEALREAVRRVRARVPFHIDAWVVLPDHMHC